MDVGTGFLKASVRSRTRHRFFQLLYPYFLCCQRSNVKKTFFSYQVCPNIASLIAAAFLSPNGLLCDFRLVTTAHPQAQLPSSVSQDQ
jgi:hypothetical protein